MILTKAEIDFLSAWAREEWTPACYGLPAHKLQIAHKITGAHLVDFIKAWAVAEGKKDTEIQQATVSQAPVWPWESLEQFNKRHSEALTHQPLHPSLV